MILSFLFILYILYFTLSDPTHGNLFSDLAGVSGGILFGYLIIIRKKITSIPRGQTMLLVISILLIFYTNLQGMLLLPSTEIPHLKSYVKLIYLTGLFLLIYFHYKKYPPFASLTISVLFSTHLLLNFYNIGITLKTIPLLLYLLSYTALFRSFDNYKFNIFDITILLILASATTSAFFSWNRLNGIMAYSQIAAGILLYFIARKEILPAPRNFFIPFSLLSTVYLIYIFLFISLKTIYPSPNFSEIEIARINVNYYGGYLSIIFPFFLSMTLYRYKNYKLSFFLLLTTALFLFKFESRSSLLGIIFSSGIFVLLTTFRTFLVRIIYDIKLVSAFIIIAITFIYFILHFQLIDPQTFIIRLHLWKLFLLRTIEFAPITGFGHGNEMINALLPINSFNGENLKQFTDFFQSYNNYPHAHNLLVSLIFSYGLIGFLAWSSFVIVGLAQTFYQTKETSVNKDYIISLTVFSAVFIQSIFDLTLFDPNTFFPLVFFSALFSLTAFKTHVFQIKTYKFPVLVQIILYLSLFYLSIDINNNAKILNLYSGKFRSDSFLNVIIPEGNCPIDNKSIEDLSRTTPVKSYINHIKYQITGEIYFCMAAADKQYLVKAEENYSAALAIFPWNPFLKERLSEIYAKEGFKEIAGLYHFLATINDPFKIILIYK